MTDFLTHPATVYALIAYGALVSIGCAILSYLWQLEKDEAERAEKAAKFFEDKSAELINIRDGHKEVLKHATDLITGLDVTNKALADTNAHLTEILTKAYVRNAYGQLQRYDDWAINGDRKPKPRTK